MIYKNGVRANKIELLVDETKQTIICHIHLSNGKVFTGKPEKVDAAIIHNQVKLENLSMLIIGHSLKLLKKEMK